MSNAIATFTNQWRAPLLRACGTEAKAQRLIDAFKVAAYETDGIQDVIAKNPTSVGRCLMEAASIDLLPGKKLKHCSLIPRGGACELSVEYRGYIHMAKRGGDLDYLGAAKLVYASDEFHVSDGKVTHRQPLAEYAKRTDDNCIGAYVEFKVKGAPPDVWVMDRAQIDKRKNAAKTKNVWNQWYEEMAKKTVYRAFCNSGLVSLVPPGDYGANDLPEAVEVVDFTEVPDIVASEDEGANAEALEERLAIQSEA